MTEGHKSEGSFPNTSGWQISSPRNKENPYEYNPC
jgi:hypothetical protein